MNDREARFSQPKLEIYRLFRVLRALRLYIIGMRNFGRRDRCEVH